MQLAIILIFYFLSLTVLLIYSLSYLLGFLVVVLGRKKEAIHVEIRDRGNVAVLVPSYDEGEALIDTLKTILAQDYAGLISVYILIKDVQDTSHQFLSAFLQKTELADNRQIKVCLTGEQKKKEKINIVLPTLDENFIAFLDADHRADDQWVSSSLTLMENERHDAIQAVRRPLAISSFFQVWDSLQNHIGNEVFNTLYRKFNLTTFFTGTTCIFNAETLKGKLFPVSLTEDTFLSYELILSGKKIGYNPYYGSYEEVAPDVSSYISRRRRWSNGHNHTFFSNFKKIIKSKMSFRNKVQQLLHGAYYLLPLVIVLITNIVGWYYYFQYTNNIQILSLGFAAFIALSVGLLRYSNFKELMYESLIGFINFFPYVSLFSIFLYKIYQYEVYYHIISFPFHKAMFWVSLTMVMGPILVLVGGRSLYKYPSLGVFISHLLFYPIVLLVDIFGSILGLCDLIFKRTSWGKVNRSNVVDSSIVPKNIVDNTDHRKLKVRKFYSIILVPVLAILVILANDFLVFHNCGEPQYFFSKHLFYEMTPPLNSQLSYQISAAGNGQYQLKVLNNVENNEKYSGKLTLSVDGKKIYQGPIETKMFDHTGPMGWDTGIMTTEIETDGFSCVQKKKYSTSVKEIINGKLYVNGDPFLIKCIISSFSNSKVNVDLETGFKQIKRAGANCVRVYHTPKEDLLDEARKQQLLIISQPDETTWENITMSNNSSIKLLIRRYKYHVHLTEGYPYILFDNLGNELELNSEVGKSIVNIKETLNEIQERPYYRFPISYSTYFTYIKYPLDILGINMLDTGDVYWRDALNYTKSLNIPFYASEFGGFVAFFERTPTFLRIHRLYEDWQHLLDNGSLGAAFFQSHDNWAQPVPSGYNDPFRDEMPDDTRGFWDINNKPKEELNHLSTILSDFSFHHNGGGKLKVVNRRAFNLQNIKLIIQKVSYDINELKPDQEFIIDLKEAGQFLKIEATYLTHLGFKNELEFTLDLLKGMKPTILFPVALDVKQSHDGLNWEDFRLGNKEGGRLFLKFILPSNTPDSAYLMLNGLGTEKIKLTDIDGNRGVNIPVHSYREEILQVDAIRKQLGNVSEFIIEIMNRDHIKYLDESDGKNIFIAIKKPYLIENAM